MSACLCCQIAADAAQEGALFALGTHWTANVRVGHARPAVVIQTVRHRASLADLSRGESSTLGPAVEAVYRLMSAQPGVRLVHVNYWNESPDGHVHFHLVPVFDDDVLSGPALADELTPLAAASDFRRMLGALRGEDVWRSAEPSKLVRAALRVTTGWQRWSTYRLTKRLVDADGTWRGFDAAEIQVMGWLSILLAAWAAAGVWGQVDAIGWIVTIVACYRLADVGIYEAGILLARTPVALRSVPRALILRVLNVAEVFLVSAIVASVALDGAARRSLQFGYETIALQPPFGLPGLIMDALLATCSTIALLLAAGGIALLVSVSAQRFGEF